MHEIAVDHGDMRLRPTVVIPRDHEIFFGVRSKANPIRKLKRINAWSDANAQDNSNDNSQGCPYSRLMSRDSRSKLSFSSKRPL